MLLLHLAAVTKCARSVCHGHCLRHCSRAARRCRSISRAHPMRAHIVRSRGQVAVHSRTPAVAARMPPAAMLVINLRIGAAADCCCGNSSSLLLPDSVKPAVQRGVQNSRGLLSLLRLSAFEPVDRSWMVPRVSLRRGVLAMAGLRSVRWRAERATKQRENQGSDGCHKTSDLAHPGLDLVRQSPSTVAHTQKPQSMVHR